MKVGGNSENSEKKTVSPAADAPSRVTVNVLLTPEALAVGLRVTKNSFQSVESAPDTLEEEDARVVPSPETKDAVSLPLNVDPCANLKLKDAL